MQINSIINVIKKVYFFDRVLVKAKILSLGVQILIYAKKIGRYYRHPGLRT